MLQGCEPVQVYPLYKDEIFIGRGSDVDIRLADPCISRQHLRLVRAPNGGYHIQDLFSRNGTYLNGRRVSSAEQLYEGDRITLGRASLLRFS